MKGKSIGSKSPRKASGKGGCPKASKKGGKSLPSKRPKNQC